MVALPEPQLDDVDRAVIAELQRDGRASWQAIADRVGTSPATAARRAQRLIATDVVRVVGVIDPLRCGLGTPVLIRLQTLPGRMREALAVLTARADVRFLAVVTGSTDVVAELIVASPAHLARLVVEELQVVPGVESTTTAPVMRHYKLSHHEQLAGDVGPDGRPEGGPVPLDELDLRIAGELGTDGRMSAATLATNLGITESTARRRVEGLLSDGRISISTLLDAGTLGFEVEALVWLGIDLAHLEAASEVLRARPEVRYLAAAVGDAELVAEVLLRDQADLYRFATGVLGGIQGLRRTEVCLELDVLKRAYVRTGGGAVDLPDGRGRGVA